MHVVSEPGGQSAKSRDGGQTNTRPSRWSSDGGQKYVIYSLSEFVVFI